MKKIAQSVFVAVTSLSSGQRLESILIHDDTLAGTQFAAMFVVNPVHQNVHMISR